MNRLATSLILATLALAPLGCKEEAAAPRPAAAKPAPAAAFPPSLFLAAAPDAKPVKATKPTLKAGDTVTLKGRIGGGEEPFVDGRAMFTLVDAALPACSDAKDDHCKTPWDYCCVPQDELAANSVTVQVVGPDGKPVKSGLNNVHGLKPLATVTVVGKVSQAEGSAIVLDATGLYVAP